jgi:hypothetical protein
LAPDRRWHVFVNEVYNATEIDQGADPKIRDQELTLAERLISELSETEFQPEKYEDEIGRVSSRRSTEDRGSGSLARRGRGPASNNRSGRDAQSEPRTEGTGQGLLREVKAGTRIGETAGPAEARLVVVDRLARRRRRREGSGCPALQSRLEELEALCQARFAAVARGFRTIPSESDDVLSKDMGASVFGGMCRKMIVGSPTPIARTLRELLLLERQKVGPDDPGQVHPGQGANDGDQRPGVRPQE